MKLATDSLNENKHVSRNHAGPQFTHTKLLHKDKRCMSNNRKYG